MSEENRAMDDMRLEVSIRLLKIADLFRELGLPLSNLTLIARDPTNDKMFVCLTNEDKAGLEQACALALADQKG